MVRTSVGASQVYRTAEHKMLKDIRDTLTDNFEFVHRLRQDQQQFEQHLISKNTEVLQESQKARSEICFELNAINSTMKDLCGALELGYGGTVGI